MTEREFDRAVLPILRHPLVNKTRKCIQHGDITVYGHSLAVARYSVRLARLFKIPCDMKSLARGAVLHDFFLYDWHETNDCGDGLHGFAHPKTALRNASRCFELNSTERDIIRKHMWPLTFFCMPARRESWIVCFVDKFCSVLETLGINRYGNDTFTPEEAKKFFEKK